jgi:outer membrane protein OmpA-like peptidoglycan-associated protein
MAEPEVVWSDNIKIKEWSKNNCKEGCNFYINKDDKVVVKENKGRNYWIVNIDDKPFVEKKEMLNIRQNLNPTNDLTEFYGKNDKVQTLILNKDGIKRYFTNQGEFLAIAKIDTARYGILTDLASCNYFNIGDIIKKDDMNEPEEVGIDITKNSKESIRLKSVLFKLGESELMPESYAELNALVRQMKKHTEIEILLEGHTDITGDATENLQLSIDRVDACKRYLVQQGITPFRIQTKGYGSSKPLIRKGSEKEREANRRVEVKVLKNSQ